MSKRVVESFDIPSYEEMPKRAGDSYRPTEVKMTLEITGGTIPEHERVEILVPKFSLHTVGQLRLRFIEDDMDHIDYDGANELPPTPDRYFKMELDEADMPRDDVQFQVRVIETGESNGQEG